MDISFQLVIILYYSEKLIKMKIRRPCCADIENIILNEIISMKYWSNDSHIRIRIWPHSTKLIAYTLPVLTFLFIITDVNSHSFLWHILWGIFLKIGTTVSFNALIFVIEMQSTNKLSPKRKSKRKHKDLLNILRVHGFYEQ